MNLVLVALLAGIAPAAEAPDTAVVCPRPLVAALRPWIKYRQEQGHRIALIDGRESAEEIRGEIREVARQGGLRFVVLIGDADPRAARDPKVRELSTPTHHVRAKVNVHWGSEPRIATDNAYADLDDDGIPDVAIGRIPADDEAELELMTRKAMTYEQQGVGLWCRRLNFVAGVGGFGVLADSVLEMATKRFLTTGVPSSYVTKVTYGSWRSPYCPDPRRFHDAAVTRFNEGCLFWVYIGHGQRHYLDRVRVPGGSYHILDVRDVDKLEPTEGMPIAVFLACYTGAFDDARDCLAEEMLGSRRGPVAVLSGSRVTMPYAMAVMSDAMLNEYFRSRRRTLGETILHAKRRMVAQAEDDQNRKMLDAIALAISPAKDQLPEERREHLSLFNLLGDPLLRLPYPEEMALESEFNVDAGGKLTVRGQSPVAGALTIDFAVRRDGLRFDAPTRGEYDDTDRALSRYQDVYHQAIDQRWATTTREVTRGRFEQELDIPREARGLCHVRAVVLGKGDMAIGAADVFVRRPSGK